MERRSLPPQDTMQAAVNATQEMLMRQNLNDGATSPQESILLVPVSAKNFSDKFIYNWQ
jgi:hypothetical protein